jgi:hypothetical protein
VKTVLLIIANGAAILAGVTSRSRRTGTGAHRGEMIDRATVVGLGEGISVDEGWIVEGMGRLAAAGGPSYRLGASVRSGYFALRSDRRKPDD